MHPCFQAFVEMAFTYTQELEIIHLKESKKSPESLQLCLRWLDTPLYIFFIDLHRMLFFQCMILEIRDRY